MPFGDILAFFRQIGGMPGKVKKCVIERLNDTHLPEDEMKVVVGRSVLSIGTVLFSVTSFSKKQSGALVQRTTVWEWKNSGRLVLGRSKKDIETVVREAAQAVQNEIVFNVMRS